MNGLNVAVVGAGDPHNDLYVRLLQSYDSLVSRVPLFAPSLEEMAHHPTHPRQGPRYTDLSEMLKKEELDAAILLVSHDRKPEFTETLCANGAHILCEKSGAVSAKNFEKMIASAKKHGRRLSVCYPWRNNPATHDVRALLANELGPIRSFEMRFNGTRLAQRRSEPAEPSEGWTWLRDHKRSGGGILAWLGVHWIDLAHHLFGPAASLSAMTARYTNEVKDVEENAHLTLTTESGALGSIRAGWVLPPGAKDLYIGIDAEEGAVQWWPAGPTPHLIVHRKEWGRDTTEKQYSAEVADNDVWIGDFVRQFLTSAVQGKGQMMVCEEDGLYVMKVLDAAYRSAEKGVTVSDNPTQIIDGGAFPDSSVRRG